MGHTGYPVFWLIFAQSGNSAPCTRPQLAEAQIPSSASRLGCFAHWSAPEAPHSVSGPRVHLGKGPFLFLCPATTSPLHWVLRGSGGTAPRGSPQGTTAGSKDGRRCLVLGGPPLNTPWPCGQGECNPRERAGAFTLPGTSFINSGARGGPVPPQRLVL